MNWAGKRVLITGATGFIGGRLVERLILEQGAEVTALVHQFKNASRLARFSLRMAPGDVTDLTSVRAAAEGCDYIVHCAVSFAGSGKENRRTTVEGARNLCEVAREINAEGLIHLSTSSVYGDVPRGALDEQTPRHPTDAYGASKLEAEHLVEQYQQQGLPCTILEPTVVYGPWSFWTTYAATQVTRGTVVLPDDGHGLCHAVYVDDVVEAILLGLQCAQERAGRYLVSGPAPTTWRDFYLNHAGDQSDVNVQGMDLDTLLANVKPKAPARGMAKLVESLRYNRNAQGLLLDLPLVGKSLRTIKRVMPETVEKFTTKRHPNISRKRQKKEKLVLPHPDHVQLMASRATVSVDRARSKLGYQPQFDFQRGMQLAKMWLRWAALLKG